MLKQICQNSFAQIITYIKADISVKSDGAAGTEQSYTQDFDSETERAVGGGSVTG